MGQETSGERRPTAEMAVREAVRCCPATLPVFSRAGIDTCCGGGMTIREAASLTGIDLRDLLDELRSVTDSR